MHARHAIRRSLAHPKAAAHLVRHHIQARAAGLEADPILRAPGALVFLQTTEHAGKRVGVQRGLDVKALDVLANELAHAFAGALQHRRRRVHVALAVHERVDVVVITNRAISRQSRIDRLVPAVHRDEVDVGIDQQMAVGDALVDPDFLVFFRFAKQDVAVRILRVMVVEPFGMEGVENARRKIHPQFTLKTRKNRATAEKK
jgi:hypothetical protein